MTHQFSTWRLIRSAPASGAWNMAVDEAILTAVNRGNRQTTLRVYAWDPPCLSLGYAQSSDDVDMQALQKEAWQMVRRLTGGRAILHTDELTYSVIGPDSDPNLQGSILSSYRHLSTALMKMLSSLGLDVRALPEKQANHEKDMDPVCFDVPSNYEITYAGKKLVGSAQARKQKGILQHGTLPLFGDLTRITRVLRYADEAQRQQAAGKLLARATSIETALGKQLGWAAAADALVEAFASQLNIRFEESTLSQQELTDAEKLMAQKYNHIDWNQRF